MALERAQAAAAVVAFSVCKLKVQGVLCHFLFKPQQAQKHVCLGYIVYIPEA